MELVVIESPFAGKGSTEEEKDVQTERNLRYVRACMADAFARGEAPYASHALYTQPGVLNDKIPEERRKGMDAGFLWGEKASKRVLYTDLGMSSGMIEGVKQAEKLGQKLEERSLGNLWAVIEPWLRLPISVAAQLTSNIRTLPRAVRGNTHPSFEQGYNQAICDVLNLISAAK